MMCAYIRVQHERIYMLFEGRGFCYRDTRTTFMSTYIDYSDHKPFSVVWASHKLSAECFLSNIYI